jgi:recombination protein RecA
VDLSADRTTQFRQALDAIHRRWGSNALRPLADLTSTSACIPTGYPDLDRVISGGIPCGKITELSGIPTCGMTSLALSIVAQAQQQGRLGVYVDLAKALDPGYAAHRGVRLDGLLIARPDDVISAFDVLQIVADEGKAGLVVLDPAPPEEKLFSQALRRLVPALRQSGCTALVLNPHAATASLAQQAALRLSVENTGWVMRGRDICGWRARVTVTKDRRGHPNRHSDLEILLDDRAQEAAA